MGVILSFAVDVPFQTGRQENLTDFPAYLPCAYLDIK